VVRCGRALSRRTPFPARLAGFPERLVECASGRATLTQTMRFAYKEGRDQASEAGMTEGMRMSYDRLAEIVEGQKVA
jgi:hypothetical protein